MSGLGLEGLAAVTAGDISGPALNLAEWLR
jgi:hypothetical protein